MAAMKLRRNGAIALVAGIIMMLLASGPASAVEPPPPVADFPDVPSRLLKSVTGTPIGDAVFNMARAMLDQGAKAPTVPVPKPIAPAVSLTRGAAGGPLVGTFFAGFALGQAGLITYGAVTGTDPLGPICGSPFEGVGSVLYIGMMPDCTTTLDVPNADQQPSFMVGTRSVWTPTAVSGAYTYVMGCAAGGAVPTGQTFGVTFQVIYTGGPGASSTTYNSLATPASLCGGGAASWSNCYKVHPSIQSSGLCTGIRITRAWIYQNSNGAVVSEGVETRADPTRQARCKVTGDGVTITRDGSTYTESAGLPVTSAGLGCAQAYEDFISDPGRGPGFLPDKIEVESVDGGVVTEIAEAPVPGEYTPDQEKGLQQGNGRGLVLEKVVGNQLLSCMTWAADCSGWWSATSEGTNQGSYRCTYAGAAINISECGVYRTTFEIQTSTPTITDPDTGLETPWVTGPATSTGTNTGTFPSTGTNPGAATSTATGGGGCTAGWSWNPVDWVLNPIRCAFIPSEASVTGTLNALGESAGDLAAVDPLMALLDTLPASGGCAGIPIELTFFGETASGSLLGACDGYGATAAAVVNGLLSLAIATGAVIAVTRYAAAVFGFVGPGGGFEQQQYSNQMMARSAARSD